MTDRLVRGTLGGVGPLIVTPITVDGMVGYDQFGQLVHTLKERDRETSTFISDVRDKVCAICAHGWLPNGPSMRDQLRWSLIDDYVHETCLVRHVGLTERSLFQRAIVQAGLRFEKMVPIANGYWIGDDPWAAKPWYRIALLDHDIDIEIGQRKRVTSIEVAPRYDDVLVWYKDAETAFAGANVTKTFAADGILLHAWSDDDVRAYLKTLATVGRLDQKEDDR